MKEEEGGKEAENIGHKRPTMVHCLDIEAIFSLLVGGEEEQDKDTGTAA